MRRASLFLLLLLLAVAPAAARGEDEATGAPWRGILPDPDPTLEAEHFVCRVVDDVTGRPVEGARLVRTPEWIAPGRVRHDVPLGVAFTDALGITWLPTTPGRWEEDCHWLVTAKGYGFVYEYGALPPLEMRLPPEVPMHGRVVDALGRPVAGALVEALGGCSHGTAAASVRTGGDGTFVLQGVDVLPGQLWVEGAGIAADLLALSSPESLGTHGVLLAMETGYRFRGRVVDLLGAPLPRTVVRVYNEQRGPATAAGPDGAFLLEGAEDPDGLVVFPAADLTEDESNWHVSDVIPEVACTLVVGPLGVVEEEPTGTLRIRALDESGRPVGGLWVAALSAATRRGPEGCTATADEKEDGLAIGEVLEEVAAGPWRIVPTDPLASHTFEPVDVAAGTASVDLVVRAQPRLRIVGDLPPDADLLLAVEGASTSILDANGEPLPCLPARGPAALRVTDKGRPPFFFVIEEAIDGVRTVRVSMPPLRRVVLPPGATDARLADGEREAYHRGDEAAGMLLTDASGPLTLSYDDADGRRRTLEIDLPGEPGTTLVVDAGEARVVLPEPEDEDEPRTGACTLLVTVRDEDGPVDAVVLVGAALHAARDGRLRVEDLPAGPIRVVVARRDVVGPGRVLDVVLAPKEPATVTVDLPLE